MDPIIQHSGKGKDIETVSTSVYAKGLGAERTEQVEHGRII